MILEGKIVFNNWFYLNFVHSGSSSETEIIYDDLKFQG